MRTALSVFSFALFVGFAVCCVAAMTGCATSASPALGDLVHKFMADGVISPEEAKALVTAAGPPATDWAAVVTTATSAIVAALTGGYLGKSAALRSIRPQIEGATVRMAALEKKSSASGTA